MTDNEIIKALPMVAYGGHYCNKCKYKFEKGECRCGLKGCRITRNALDLINRQKAEIERLQKKREAKCGTCYYAKPTTFGKSKSYVECTNKEHIEKFCRYRKISLKRQRTTPACKCYKEMEQSVNYKSSKLERK